MKKIIAISLVAILAVGSVFAAPAFSGKFATELAYDLGEHRLAFDNGVKSEIKAAFDLSTEKVNEGDIYATLKAELKLELKNSYTDEDKYEKIKLDSDVTFKLTEASINGQGWSVGILNASSLPSYAKGFETYNDGDDSVDSTMAEIKGVPGVNFTVDGIVKGGVGIDYDFDEDASKSALAWAATDGLAFGDVTVDAGVGLVKKAGSGFFNIGIGAKAGYATDLFTVSVASDTFTGISTKEGVDSTFDMDVTANVTYDNLLDATVYYATEAKLGEVAYDATAPKVSFTLVDDYAMSFKDMTGETEYPLISGIGRGYYVNLFNIMSSEVPADVTSIAIASENYLATKVAFDLNAFDVPVSFTLAGLDLVNNPYFDLEAKATVADVEITAFGGYQALIVEEDLFANVFHVGADAAYTFAPVGKLSAGVTYVGYLADAEGAEVMNALTLKAGLVNDTLISGATLEAGYESGNLIKDNMFMAQSFGKIYAKATIAF